MPSNADDLKEFVLQAVTDEIEFKIDKEDFAEIERRVIRILRPIVSRIDALEAKQAGKANPVVDSAEDEKPAVAETPKPRRAIVAKMK